MINWILRVQNFQTHAYPGTSQNVQFRCFTHSLPSAGWKHPETRSLPRWDQLSWVPPQPGSRKRSEPSSVTSLPIFFRWEYGDPMDSA